MPYLQFDRNKLFIKKLSERQNQISIEDAHISPGYTPSKLSAKDNEIIDKAAKKIIAAREKGKSVILAFGAHTIKNGLAPVLMELIGKGWVTHLATNGAGIIHDWEFAFQGKSGEDVRGNVRQGQFGIWEETGFFINLALVAGSYEGLGYGESIGKMISREGLSIPEISYLLNEAKEKMETDPEFSAAAVEFSGIIKKYGLEPGFMKIKYPWKKYSIQCSAYDLKVPFTGHPMIGHDIIYNHPANYGAAIGRTSLRDFLCFAHSVSNIDHGVYLSLGSSVMSPMIFEKSLSMAQNIEIQKSRHIDNHFMLIVDLARTEWDWEKKGEPMADNPAYYLRYCKTFNRMGGEMHYLQADNRDFLAQLYLFLKQQVQE